MELAVAKLPNQLPEVTAKQRAVDRLPLPQRRRRFSKETAMSVAVVGGLAAAGSQSQPNPAGPGCAPPCHIMTPLWLSRRVHMYKNKKNQVLPR